MALGLQVNKLGKGAMRHFIAILIKKWLLEVVVILAKKYPFPTEQNVWHPNARILLDTLNLFRECEKNQGRLRLFEAVFRIVIDEYQRHTFYRGRIDRVVAKIKESDWLPPSTKPMSFWEEAREVQTGTLFPAKSLERIMEAEEPTRSVLIQNLILSAGEERIFGE